MIFWNTTNIRSFERGLMFRHGDFIRPLTPSKVRIPLWNLRRDKVEPGQDLLLYRDGVLIDRLAEGLHVFWKGTGKIKWKAVDRREQVADVAGQEIMTSDKVTLRVNLIVTYLVEDAVKATAAS